MVGQNIINYGKNNKITIRDVKLRKDMYGYSLDLTYTVESLEEICELHIPRLMLPISNAEVILRTEHDYYGSVRNTADIGFGECRALDVDGAAFTFKTIKTKTKEMTLDEIEKKLGHKVKIVNK